MSAVDIHKKEIMSMFSSILTKRGTIHAFVGGSVRNLLGSERDTFDIGVGVAVDSKAMGGIEHQTMMYGDLPSTEDNK
ncbi:hypothetical protein FPOAC2_01561 [Fusarium poae]